MNCDEKLTHAHAEQWRTDWKALDFESVTRRLEQLYWLRDYVMAASESIPLSWQRFLMTQIDAGERRLLDFQAVEEACTDESPTPLIAPEEAVPVYAATDEDIPF